MTDRTSEPDEPRDVEVDLTGGANLEVDTVDVETGEPPLSFSIEGAIRGVDEEILRELSGGSVTPVSVRFRVSDE